MFLHFFCDVWLYWPETNTPPEDTRQLELPPWVPAELLEKIPAALSQLYIQAYPLLDDPDFVALAEKNGFDGAVHAGSGVGFGSVEYRIFDVKQASILSIETLN